MIEHFKQQDPIGLPLVPLPDPIVIAFQRSCEPFLSLIVSRTFLIFVKA